MTPANGLSLSLSSAVRRRCGVYQRDMAPVRAPNNVICSAIEACAKPLLFKIGDLGSRRSERRSMLPAGSFA